MKRYRVQVGYQVYHQTWVEVEAANEDEAYSMAMTKAGNEVLDYEPDPYDEGGELETLQCEEIDEA